MYYSVISIRKDMGRDLWLLGLRHLVHGELRSLAVPLLDLEFAEWVIQDSYDRRDSRDADIRMLVKVQGTAITEFIPNNHRTREKMISEWFDVLDPNDLYALSGCIDRVEILQEQGVTMGRAVVDLPQLGRGARFPITVSAIGNSAEREIEVYYRLMYDIRHTVSKYLLNRR